MGGWVGDYFNDFGNGDDALDKMVKDIARLPQVQPLGTIWSYNNTGFNVASRIIEIVTKKPYEQAAQEMLLDPLGLNMSFFYPSDILFTHRFVVGHQKVKEQGSGGASVGDRQGRQRRGRSRQYGPGSAQIRALPHEQWEEKRHHG